MQTFIGIDWGEAKIGTAFADEETRIAFGGGILENDAMAHDKLWSLCAQHSDCAFVIGMTKNDEQSDNTEKIKDFAKKLKKLSKKKVHFAEEMFTTKEAQANLKAAGKKDITKNDDIEAARILLQSYLDNEKKSHK